MSVLAPPYQQFLVPLKRVLRHQCSAASFDKTDNLTIKFLGLAASNGMTQPCQHNIHIYLQYGGTFTARSCHAVPLCAARHSVDVPLCSKSWERAGWYFGVQSVTLCGMETSTLESWLYAFNYLILWLYEQKIVFNFFRLFKLQKLVNFFLTDTW